MKMRVLLITIFLFCLITSPVMAQADQPPAETTEKALNLGTLFVEVGTLSVLISCSVAQLKDFGLTGKKLTYSAYAVGLILGGGYRFFTYTPTTPADWFYLVLFGLAGGFIATGVYKGLENATGGKAIKEDIATRVWTGR